MECWDKIFFIVFYWKTGFKIRNCFYVEFEILNASFLAYHLALSINCNCGPSWFHVLQRIESVSEFPICAISTFLLFLLLCLISRYPSYNSHASCSMDSNPIHPMFSFPFSLMSLNCLLLNNTYQILQNTVMIHWLTCWQDLLKVPSVLPLPCGIEDSKEFHF